MAYLFPTRRSQTFKRAIRLCQSREIVRFEQDGQAVYFRPETVNSGPDGYPEVEGPLYHYVGDGESDRYTRDRSGWGGTAAVVRVHCSEVQHDGLNLG